MTIIAVTIIAVTIITVAIIIPWLLFVWLLCCGYYYTVAFICVAIMLWLLWRASPEMRRNREKLRCISVHCGYYCTVAFIHVAILFVWLLWRASPEMRRSREKLRIFLIQTRMAMTRVETETGLHLLFLQKAPEFETREKRKILNFHEKVVHIHRVFV